MLPLHRLQAQARPAVADTGRPKDEPMRDGVLPLGMLELLHFAYESIENFWELCHR